MEQSVLSRRKNAPAQGELIFRDTEEELRALGQRTGKLLLVSDGTMNPAFAGAACSPRVLSVIYTGDVLPLFSVPDGIGQVAVSGGSDAIHAVRAFALIRRIPCTVFPASLTLDGALETRGEIAVGDASTELPLAPAETVCDEARLNGTRGDAFARLLLHVLASFGRYAVARLNGTLCAPPVFSLPQAESGRDLARCNFTSGALDGDGAALKSRLQGQAEWRAYLQLSALYAAFVKCGKPRRFYAPAYRARAEREKVGMPKIPTLGEYAARAMALERCRAELGRAIAPFIRTRSECFARMRCLAGSAEAAGDLTALKYVGEHVPDGLCAVIRDFGLTEWEDGCDFSRREDDDEGRVVS